jgi:hypothetical protein
VQIVPVGLVEEVMLFQLISVICVDVNPSVVSGSLVRRDIDVHAINRGSLFRVVIQDVFLRAESSLPLTQQQLDKMNSFIRCDPVAFFAIAFVLDFLGKIEIFAVSENAHLGVLCSVAVETLVQDGAYTPPITTAII